MQITQQNHWKPKTTTTLVLNRLRASGVFNRLRLNITIKLTLVLPITWGKYRVFDKVGAESPQNRVFRKTLLKSRFELIVCLLHLCFVILVFSASCFCFCKTTFHKQLLLVYVHVDFLYLITTYKRVFCQCKYVSKKVVIRIIMPPSKH